MFGVGAGVRGVSGFEDDVESVEVGAGKSVGGVGMKRGLGAEMNLMRTTKRMRMWALGALFSIAVSMREGDRLRERTGEHLVYTGERH